MADSGVDLLHPFARLSWEECCKLPDGRHDAQCVLVGNILYVGGGSADKGKDHAKLFVSSTDLKSWSELATPTGLYALATYHSQLVLIGGEDSTGLITNRIWTLTLDVGIGNNWHESLAPMPTARQASTAANAGSPECLIVAGGKGVDGLLNTVEVLADGHWSQVEPLPEKCAHMKHTFHCAKLFLMGGCKQSFSVYCCDTKALVDSSKLPDAALPAPLWSEFDRVSLCYASAASLGQLLVSIGGYGYESEPWIHAHSPRSRSWLRVESLPDDLCAVGAVVLPGEQLVVVGGEVVAGESAHKSDIPYGNRVFKASLTMQPYDPDGRFSMTQLSLLEEAGIPIVTALTQCHKQLISSAEIALGDYDGWLRRYEKIDANGLETIIDRWWWPGRGGAGKPNLPPTWRSLLDVLKKLNKEELGQQIDKYLKK